MTNTLMKLSLALLLTPATVLADRPSISELNTRVDQLESEIDALDVRVTDLEVCPASAPTRFVDNGDGTICDNQTGLIWELKDEADGVQNLSNPHDVDNVYTWTDTADGDWSNPDGTLFTDFLARLNNTAANSIEHIPFAGYTDWRIPTAAELKTIVLELYDIEPCSISPCIIDPVFAPTEEGYWTSTNNRVTPPYNTVFGISFFDGSYGGAGKNWSEHVRAVRGGR